ncbi:nitrogenase component 1 [Clostridiaceae bacterium M8S5]|nr:nitrogenase component 1 [Clostridiaceae bacterium M8S5]
MKYKYDLSLLALLDTIKSDKDIPQLSYAQFPGTHCPLFGSVMTASYIEDLVVMVVGTEECTYYAKDFAYLRQNGKDRFYSLVMDKNDVTFGCGEKVKKALKAIYKKEKPKAILIVTTCIPELIGEDYESLIIGMQEEVACKLLVVKTDHFKCNSHISGIEKTLQVFSKLMVSGEKKEKTVNILGYRYDEIENTELYKLLSDAEIKVNMTIPSSCTIENLKYAPTATVNIVVDQTAMMLAHQMKDQYGVEYVNFAKHLDIDDIDEAYNKLQELLQINLTKKLEILREKALEKVQKSKAKLSGKTFIYGNTPFDCMKLSLFLIKLGMKPILIQMREYLKKDEINIKRILDTGNNPYVSRIANIAPLRTVYDEYKPSYYLGHENPMELISRGITQIILDPVSKKLGYEVIDETLEILTNDKSFNFRNKMMKSKKKEVI